MVSVKVNNSYSCVFEVFNGTRQESVLLPTLFNMGIDVFIVPLRSLDIGCQLKSMFVECVLNTDDMILLC